MLTGLVAEEGGGGGEEQESHSKVGTLLGPTKKSMVHEKFLRAGGCVVIIQLLQTSKT